MARRKQKISREKSRTMWLAWSAWLFIGGIFVFEDTQGGTGWLTWTLTAPFWLAFVVWPFLWGYLATRRNPDYVEIDDDIRTDDSVCRLVQKDGVRYAEKASLLSAFDIRGALPTQTLAGDTEEFVPIEALRKAAKENKKLAAWLAVVDSIASPRCYY